MAKTRTHNKQQFKLKNIMKIRTRQTVHSHTSITHTGMIKDGDQVKLVYCIYILV